MPIRHRCACRQLSKNNAKIEPISSDILPNIELLHQTLIKEDLRIGPKSFVQFIER